MTGYTVDHTQLASTGQQISQQGSSSSSIAQQVQAAEVPTLAWGLLGMSCGLYEAYVAMLSDLDQHLSAMGQHLDQTGSTMVSTAQAYQQIDEQSAQTFQQIAGDLGGSASTPTGTAATAGTSATPGAQST